MSSLRLVVVSTVLVLAIASVAGAATASEAASPYPRFDELRALKDRGAG